MENVAKLLVEKEIAPETDSAKRIIKAAVKSSKHEIDWEDFNLLFCKGIFKEVLISLAHKIRATIK